VKDGIPTRCRGRATTKFMKFMVYAHFPAAERSRVRSELLGACDAKEPGAGVSRAAWRTLAEQGSVGKAIGQRWFGRVAGEFGIVSRNSRRAHVLNGAEAVHIAFKVRTDRFVQEFYDVWVNVCYSVNIINIMIFIISHIFFALVSAYKPPPTVLWINRLLPVHQAYLLPIHRYPVRSDAAAKPTSNILDLPGS